MYIIVNNFRLSYFHVDILLDRIVTDRVTQLDVKLFCMQKLVKVVEYVLLLVEVSFLRRE